MAAKKKTVTKPKTAAKNTVAKKAAAKKAAAKNTVAKKAVAKTPAAKPARKAGEVRHWLVKTEPDVFSFDDLMRAEARTTHWDGVRNYQARNTLRDEMKLGDLVLVYHSNAEPPGAVGVAKVVREGYPDHTQFDPKDGHFDPEADPASPRWFMVDLQAVAPLARLVPLPELRDAKGLQTMVLLQKGSRLSVQPVAREEFELVVKMGGGTR
jgi:predicted RNA-binding protein with PUA-like domain